MCCINIHLTVYRFIFNKYCICLLLFTIVTHDIRIKRCTTKYFFGINFTDMLIHTMHPKMNNANQHGCLVWYLTNAINYFVIFLDVRYSFKFRFHFCTCSSLVNINGILCLHVVPWACISRVDWVEPYRTSAEDTNKLTYCSFYYVLQFLSK